MCYALPTSSDERAPHDLALHEEGGLAPRLVYTTIFPLLPALTSIMELRSPHGTFFRPGT